MLGFAPSALAVQLAIDPELDLANPYRVLQEMLAATIARLPGVTSEGAGAQPRQ